MEESGLRLEEEPKPAAAVARLSETRPARSAGVERLRLAARRRKRSFDIANTCSLLSIVFALVFLWAVVTKQGEPTVITLAAVFLGLGLGTFGLAWGGVRGLRAAAAALESEDDVASIPALLEAIQMSDPRYRAALVINSEAPVYRASLPVLTRLLPRLRPEDLGLLDGRSRSLLHRALQFAADSRQKNLYDPEFAVAALAALEKVGDGSARTTVEPLTRLHEDTDDQARIRAAARSALTAILARLPDDSADRLLRPAVSAETNSLPRPVLEDPSMDSGLLLRPGGAAPSRDGSRRE